MDVMTSMDIRRTTYLDIFKLSPNFISLDISVNETGWGKWLDGEYTYGFYKLKTPESDDVGRRREFREFLKELFGDDQFEYCFIEDVIGGVNFKTNKILYQLNPIADDLIADGILHAKQVVREGNTEWKSYLRKCSGYKSKIVGSSEVKADIQAALHMMDFGSPDAAIAEGSYDATGMAIAIIYKRYVLAKQLKAPKLKTDITKGYKVKQFADEFEALDYANELPREIVEVDFLEINRDLKSNFKRFVTDLGADDKIFVIKILTSKIGLLALKKKLDLDLEVSYLVVYK